MFPGYHFVHAFGFMIGVRYECGSFGGPSPSDSQPKHLPLAPPRVPVATGFQDADITSVRFILGSFRNYGLAHSRRGAGSSRP